MASSGLSADRVIFSIAIVYSESLFTQVRQTDQHIIVSLLSILFALAAHRLSLAWSNACRCSKPDTAKKGPLWERIVTQWLHIAELTLTFIAIHSLVDTVNELISQTERYHYEAALFPVITLMFSISIVTVAEDLLRATDKCD